MAPLDTTNQYFRNIEDIPKYNEEELTSDEDDDDDDSDVQELNTTTTPRSRYSDVSRIWNLHRVRRRLFPSE